MNKYKIVGIVNLLISIFPLLLSIIFLFSIPNLNILNIDLNFDSFLDLTLADITIFLIIIISFINLFVGIKRLNESQEKYYKFGIIYLVIIIILLGFLAPILSTSVIVPLNNPSQF